MQISELGLSVSYNDQLNPLLWDGDQLKLEVRYKLLDIARNFIQFINVKPMRLRDVTISGSNASYGYSNSSDIDLHLIVDNPSKDYLQLFDAKKNQFNSEHDIKIRGIDVEVYVQPKDDPHHSLGIYSVLDDQWITQPKYDKPNVDSKEVRAKARNYSSKINHALQSKDLDQIMIIWSDLKRLRQAGLESGGEYSIENLAFKHLRNKGKIGKLSKYIKKLKSERLSLEGIEQ
jgi:hypothetical protein